MVTFVGAEYIIANVLIALKKIGKRDFINLDELSQFGVYIQQKSLNENIDAIFLFSSEQVSSAIYNFSDYFEYNDTNNSIYTAKTKNIDDLESRFIGYLPFKVLIFLVNVSMEFVEQNI